MLEDPKNFLELVEINIGERAKETLKTLPKVSQLTFLNEAKNCYVAAVNHLLKKVTCLSTLKYFQCLAPENIKNSGSVGYIIKISKLLPLTNIDTNKLEYEWRLLQQDHNLTFRLDQNQRIDSYWSNIFKIKSDVNHENPKYQEIKRVVQNALALTHGNADVERGFSESGNILTSEKSRMSEKMLNSKLHINNGLKKY